MISIFTQLPPLENIFSFWESVNEPIAFDKSFIAELNAFSILPRPANLDATALVSIPPLFKSPTLRAATNLPSFHDTNKFCPSVFSVATFSILRLPWRDNLIISFISPKVKLLSSNGWDICPAAPPSTKRPSPNKSSNSVFGSSTLTEYSAPK